MSIIFFCADFFTFSYLKSASNSFGGVQNNMVRKGRGGGFFTHLCNDLVHSDMVIHTSMVIHNSILTSL